MGHTRLGDFLVRLIGAALLRSRVTDLGGKVFCDGRIAELRHILDRWDDLSRWGRAVVGVDQSSEMLEVARPRLPQVELEQGAVDALPLPDASVDLVACSLALTFRLDTVDRPVGHRDLLSQLLHVVARAKREHR